MLSMMTSRRFLRLLLELSLLALLTFAVFSFFASVSAQTPARATAAQAHAGTNTPDEPPLREYRGVRIGQTTDETRLKLGEPTDKGETQDYYAFSDKEMAQFYYDESHRVRAISITYVGEGAPSPQSILGSTIEPNANGIIYKLVRYPRAGYWVSYSRTTGDAPIITVVLQKF